MWPDKTCVYDPLICLELSEQRCGQTARGVVALFQAAGYPARLVQLGMHTSSEVYYDDDWHYIDAGLFGAKWTVYDQDGSIPSYAELSRRPYAIDAMPSNFEPTYENQPLGSAVYSSWFYFSKQSYSTPALWYVKTATRDQEKASRIYGWEHYKTVKDDVRVLGDFDKKYHPGAPLGLRLDGNRISWRPAADLDGDLIGYRVYMGSTSRGWCYGPHWKPEMYDARFKLPPGDVAVIETTKTVISLPESRPLFVTVMAYDKHGESVSRKLYPMSHEIVVRETQSAAKSDTARPHLAKAIETIHKQVEWFGPNPEKYSREFLYGLATMNHVQSRLSPLNYSILVKANKKPPLNTEECLALEAGICGSQVQAFLAIVKQFGIRARPVEFYLRGSIPAKNHSHICAEVFYDDGWHFFDVTWGTFYRRPDGKVDGLMSWTEIRQANDPRNLATTNRSDLWYQQWCAARLDPFEYVDWSEMDVLTGRTGTIHLRATLDPKRRLLVYTPTHQPNYVGRNSSNTDTGSVKVQLMGTGQKPVTLVIDVLGIAGSGNLRVEGEQGSVSVDLRKIKTGQLKLDLSGISTKNDLRVSVIPEKPSGVGYIVFKRITLRRSES